MKNTLERPLGSRIQTVMLPQAILEEIAAESARHPATETGGALIGRIDHQTGRVEVIHLIGPGPKARRFPAAFEPDYEYQEAQCHLLLGRDPQLRYVGSWHKHPGDMRTTSGTDLRQAIEILEDPEWKTPELLMVIVTVERGHLVCSPYFITRQEPRFRKLELMGSAPPKAPPVGRENRQSRPPKGKHLHDLKGSTEWGDTDYRWFLTPFGQQRLLEEFERLTRMEVPFRTFFDEHSGLLRLHLPMHRERHDLVVSFPREYPTTPPTLACGKLSPRSHLLACWSSRLFVTDLLQECTHVRPASSPWWRRWWANFLGESEIEGTHARLTEQKGGAHAR